MLPGVPDKKEVDRRQNSEMRKGDKKQLPRLSENFMKLRTTKYLRKLFGRGVKHRACADSSKTRAGSNSIHAEST